MKYIKTIFFLVMMSFFAHGNAQPIKVDTVCCPNEREGAASLAAERAIEKLGMGLQTQNYEFCNGIIVKALKEQADSFGCCLAGRYTILVAQELLESAKEDYVSLKNVCNEVLVLLDSLKKKAKLIGVSEEKLQAPFVRLNTLYLKYVASTHLSSIMDVTALDAAINNIRSQFPPMVTPFELTYLLSKAYYHQSYKAYEIAYNCISEALGILKEGNAEPLQIGSAYNAMGLLFYEMGNNAKAVVYCDSGLAEIKKGKSPIPMFVSTASLEIPLLVNKGNSLMRLKQLELADSMLRRALLLSKGYNDRTHWVGSRVLHNYGSCQMLLGRYSEAFAKIAEANQTYFNYLFHYFNSISDDIKLELLATIDDAFHALPVLLAMQTSQVKTQIIHQVYKEQLLLKALLLKSQGLVKSAILEEKDSTTQGLYKDMVAVGNEMVQLLQGRKIWNSKKMSDLENKKREIEEELYQRSNAFRKTVNQLRITPQQVQQSLQEGETAIEFITYKELDATNRLTENKRYAAILTKYGDTVIHYMALCCENDLLRLFHQAGYNETKDTWLSQLCYNPMKKNTQYGHIDDSIYHYLLKPLLPHLQGSRTLYIAPVGLLHRLPFAALSYKGKGPLMDSFAVRTVLTTGSLVDRQTETVEPPRTVSFLYNISYGDSITRKVEWSAGWLGTLSKNLSSIDWTAQAGAAVIPGIHKKMAKRGIQVSICQQKVANEAAFKGFSGSSAAILHIDTHGFAIPIKQEASPLATDYTAWQVRHPLFYSGLLLANSKNSLQGVHLTDTAEDGILTAYEVSQMDLRQTRLVVLSACKTGLGPIVDNEGPFSLARAFKIAGAGKVIASLWSVGDKATQELLRLFYQYWLDEHKPMARAFALAQQAMARSKDYRLPYFWAGFVMIE